MRPHLFPLFCVGAASAAAGPLVGTLLAAAVAPETPFSPREVEVGPPASPTNEASLDGERLAHLLQLEARATTGPEPEPLRDYRLRGTLSPALACVEPASGGRARSVFPGDALGDATVEEVGHGYLLLRRADRLSRLTLASTPSPGARSSAGRTQTVEVSRQELEAARGRALELAQQVRVVPAFEAGVAIGFRIAWMAPDALALRAGLQQGDIVTAVNGHRLTDFEQAALLAKEVRTETRFTADVLRGGSPLRLEVKAL